MIDGPEKNVRGARSLAAATAVASDRMSLRLSVSDTTEVTPDASVAPKSRVIRSSVRSIGAAPMPPEPPQCTCESNRPGMM